MSVNGLTKKFGELTAVNHATFNVHKGEILGIIGPNGSGKTTLFNLMSGVLIPDEGTVNLKRIRKDLSLKGVFNSIFKKSKSNGFGENIVGRRPDVIVNQFGLSRTFQIVRPFKLITAEENTMVPHVSHNFFASPSKLKNKAIRSLLEVDLGEKKNYPALILPQGDLKRLDFARMMATSADIILLDEPFSGLSAEDSFRVTQLIKRANEEYGTTILIVEHKLKLLANLVNRIIVLDQGTIIADGTPEEISKNKRVISSYLGEEATFIVGN